MKPDAVDTLSLYQLISRSTAELLLCTSSPLFFQSVLHSGPPPPYLSAAVGMVCVCVCLCLCVCLFALCIVFVSRPPLLIMYTVINMWCCLLEAKSSLSEHRSHRGTERAWIKCRSAVTCTREKNSLSLRLGSELTDKLNTKQNVTPRIIN